MWRVDRKEESLGGGWVVIFLLAPTGFTDTTDDTRRSQEQQGGGDQGNDAQPHKNSHHLEVEKKQLFQHLSLPMQMCHPYVGHPEISMWKL